MVGIRWNDKQRIRFEAFLVVSGGGLVWSPVTEKEAGRRAHTHALALIRVRVRVTLWP